MKTYSSEILKTHNEPITMVHMQPRERLISDWVLDSGTKYYIDSLYYVVNLTNETLSLTLASSSTLSNNEYYFDNLTKRLYVDIGSDPSASFVFATYRLFYSTKSKDFPFDMASGIEVNYDGLLKSTSAFTDQLDHDDLTGIALSGKASIDFFDDGSWASIYSKLFWETTEVFIYNGFEGIAPNEFRLIYKGFVDGKRFSTNKISFTLKDFIEKLKSEVPLNLYTDNDGDITNQGKLKRRIYGRSKILGVSLDKIKDGFNLTGTFSKTSSQVITGVSSVLLSEATPDDRIEITNNLGELKEYSIKAVNSDTQMTITEDVEEFSDNPVIRLLPDSDGVPYKNRSMFICDHQMREPTTTVVTAIDLKTFTAASTVDFYNNDTIKIDGETKVIKIVSTNNTIVLKTRLNALPVMGDSVVKQPISNVWFDDQKMIIDRDYTITNSDPSKLVIDELAEFNLTNSNILSDGINTTLSFTSASRDVTGTLEFKNFFKPWDWVRSDDITHATWYQILEVQQSKLVLRVAYAGSTTTGDGERKNVKTINDDSRILVDANGLTFDGIKTGQWVKTGADVVKHLVNEQNLVINEASFLAASLESDYLISLAVPIDIDDSRPNVIELIDIVNQTILGSLHENADREIVYNTLTPKKTAITDILRDDDLISYEISNTGKNISKKITSKYRHEDADIFTGKYDSDVYEYDNLFISFISDIEKEQQKDLYLWNEQDALIVSQRLSLLREASNTIVKLKAGTLFLDKALNDLVYLELRDMFERFGTDADKNFIGVISYLSKKGDQTEIEVTDLGGFFNKIATYASSAAVAFLSTDKLARAQDGHFTDSNGIIDSSKQNRLNLYG